MVMMECPETVNTLLHEFFLWEPDVRPRPRSATAKARPETAKALSDPGREGSAPSRPQTAIPSSASNGQTQRTSEGKAKKK